MILQVEGINTTEQVRIVVLGGPFYSSPTASSDADYGNENRSPLMELFQTVPTRVLVSRKLKRQKDVQPLSSIILLCKLGQVSRSFVLFASNLSSFLGQDKDLGERP